MNHQVRKLFPLVALAALLGALAYAVTFGTLPPAEFSFSNSDEVKTVDPAKASGEIENRVINGLFEGLLRSMPASDTPDENGMTAMEPQPGVSELPKISADGKTYTFPIRPAAKWSNGRNITAEDFVWSWRRTLHPETGSKYAYQLYYIQGAEAYNSASVEPYDSEKADSEKADSEKADSEKTDSNGRVEIELADRQDSLQPFPRGTIRRGLLTEIVKPPKPETAGLDEEAAKDELDLWRKKWSYIVDVKPTKDGKVDWDAKGTTEKFTTTEELAAGDLQHAMQVLPDFETTVGLAAPDSSTFVVTLKERTPFFHHLVAFYTLYPVNPECVIEHGTPKWTKAENIVSNGPYQMEFRRVRDRIRMKRNPHYWNAANVKFATVDALAVKSNTAALNMYLNDEVDWITEIPKVMVPELQKDPGYRAAPALITYFYRLNVTRVPLNNVKVRQALNAAIDKKQICERVTKAGETPARSLVPPGMLGYTIAPCGEYNPERARELLAEAGYPGGKGLPKIELLYNTNDNHRAIAEVITRQWQQNLGIRVELANVEWGVYLDRQQTLDYTVCRAGWIGDYPDPNTFLDMFVTGGGQNETGWGNPEYDGLIESAGKEADPKTRMEILHRAETILMEELPILPIYYYVSINMVRPEVTGFSNNILDRHPLHILNSPNAGKGTP
ncbi:MAG: oligopeptide transport system substrate-binding protein [Pirellulaceae bacterium]|jgi:oligopeptide transport system substrate-binding protein